jgi:hypothetical protein
MQGKTDSERHNPKKFQKNIWEDPKITAKDAKGAKKNMKTSGSLFYRKVLKLTVEDVKILISTAKIAKGRERSSVLWRLFAVKINSYKFPIIY